jgi:hypothetical protein
MQSTTTCHTGIEIECSTKTAPQCHSRFCLLDWEATLGRLINIKKLTANEKVRSNNERFDSDNVREILSEFSQIKHQTAEGRLVPVDRPLFRKKEVNKFI